MIFYFHATVILSVLLSSVFVLRWRRGISVHFPIIFVFIPVINLGYLSVATATNVDEALLANGIEYLDGCFLELFMRKMDQQVAHAKHRIVSILADTHVDA